MDVFGIALTGARFGRKYCYDLEFRMKRILSLFLPALLVAALAVPALAEDEFELEPVAFAPAEELEDIPDLTEFLPEEMIGAELPMSGPGGELIEVTSDGQTEEPADQSTEEPTAAEAQTAVGLSQVPEELIGSGTSGAEPTDEPTSGPEPAEAQPSARKSQVAVWIVLIIVVAAAVVCVVLVVKKRAGKDEI